MATGGHQEAHACSRFHYLDYITINTIVCLQDFHIGGKQIKKTESLFVSSSTACNSATALKQKV